MHLKKDLRISAREKNVTEWNLWQMKTIISVESIIMKKKTLKQCMLIAVKQELSIFIFLLNPNIFVNIESFKHSISWRLKYNMYSNESQQATFCKKLYFNLPFYGPT